MNINKDFLLFDLRIQNLPSVRCNRIPSYHFLTCCDVVILHMNLPQRQICDSLVLLLVVTVALCSEIRRCWLSRLMTIMTINEVVSYVITKKNISLNRNKWVTIRMHRQHLPTLHISMTRVLLHLASIILSCICHIYPCCIEMTILFAAHSKPCLPPWEKTRRQFFWGWTPIVRLVFRLRRREPTQQSSTQHRPDKLSLLLSIQSWSRDRWFLFLPWPCSGRRHRRTNHIEQRMLGSCCLVTPRSQTHHSAKGQDEDLDIFYETVWMLYKKRLCPLSKRRHWPSTQACQQKRRRKESDPIVSYSTVHGALFENICHVSGGAMWSCSNAPHVKQHRYPISEDLIKCQFWQMW